jgi:acetylornithine deacetylase
LENETMALEERIAATVEASADRIVKTLSDLIGFPSVVKSNPKEAGPGERDCQRYLQGRLERLGFVTDLWEPDGPVLYTKYAGRPGANKGRTFEGRPNLGGILRGGGAGRSIMLTGHIDVVPPGAREHWLTFHGGSQGWLRARPRVGRHEGRRRVDADGDRALAGGRRDPCR